MVAVKDPDKKGFGGPSQRHRIYIYIYIYIRIYIYIYVPDKIFMMWRIVSEPFENL